MKWFNDSTSRQYALWGFVLGLCIVGAASVIEILDKQLPWGFASFIESQRMQPLLRLAYIGPPILGFMARMIGYHLKGTALNFGTEPISTLSAELEELGKREDLRFAPHLVEQLKMEAQRLEDFVSSQK